MSDDKNSLEQAVEQALDAFVYAPIGLIFDGPALFPKLVEKGRNQVNVARMMGQMAVQMGQSEAEKRVKEAQGQVHDTLVGLGVVPAARTGEPAPEKPAAETTTAEPAPKAAATKSPAKTQAEKSPAKKSPAKKSPASKSSAKKAPAKKRPAKKATARKAPAKKAAASKAPAVDTLVIVDYDSLSASQVVSRLRGLTNDDLAAVQAYESASRGRKTILTKIVQLQKG